MNFPEKLKTLISAGGFGLSDLKKQLLGHQASWILSALQGDEDYAKSMREFLKFLATTLKEAVSKNQANSIDNHTELNFHWYNILIGNLLNNTDLSLNSVIPVNPNNSILESVENHNK